MTTVIWTALLLGLVGSLHCAGMCGPLAVALPSQRKGRLSYLGERTIYNAGRILTYMLLGALFGLVGQTLFLVGLQRVLSILIGLVIVLAVLIGPKRWLKISSLGVIQSSILTLRSALGELMQRFGLGTMFGIGLLNGLLPCGLVYVALAGAAATGHVAGGMMYMALFGVGTLPMMMALSLAGRPMQQRIGMHFQRAIPMVLMVLGVLFILRGMALGIPYISPDLAASSCCH